MERGKDLSRDRRRRDDDRRDRRDRSRSRSRDRIHRKERSRSHDRYNRHGNRKERERERNHRDRSESPRRPAPPARARRTPRDTDDKPREPSASPPPPPSTISRMDRYFKRDYDPRLDVGEVPKTGPVTAVGWNNMLAVLKDRGKKVSYQAGIDKLTTSAVATRPRSRRHPSLSVRFVRRDCPSNRSIALRAYRRCQETRRCRGR